MTRLKLFLSFLFIASCSMVQPAKADENRQTNYDNTTIFVLTEESCFLPEAKIFTKTVYVIDAPSGKSLERGCWFEDSVNVFTYFKETKFHKAMTYSILKENWKKPEPPKPTL